MTRTRTHWLEGENPWIYVPLACLPLTARAANCLQRAQLRFVGELVCYTRAEILNIRNLGKKSADEIEDLLREMKLQLGTDVKFKTEVVAIVDIWQRHLTPLNLTRIK